MSVSALPPDVRRWLCPAVGVSLIQLGYALGAAFGLTKLEGGARTKGVAREYCGC